VNEPISKLFALVVVLFALLIAFTSRWTIFEAKSLADNPKNRRELLEEQRIERGRILTHDGTVLAKSVPTGQGGTFRRTYPKDGLFAHAVGYSFIRYGRAGLERSRNDELSGKKTSITNIIDELSGQPPKGDDIRTSLSVKGQRAALAALQGRKGSVVALEPSTGRVLVMANVPAYNPNQVPSQLGQLNHDKDSPLLDRATQAGYPPGSTFKPVTAVAAIDSGEFRPDERLSGKSPQTISGVPLQNFGGEQFGDITLTEALTKSVNTVWAKVGERVGLKTMAKYMQRFGFYAKPPIDLPRSDVLASGEYLGADMLDPTSGRIDVGRMAIGQDKLRVTPLQMAMVASAIANKGVLMRPLLATESIDPDGRRTEIKPEQMSRVMKESTAATVTAMMKNVVKDGTGGAAALTTVDVAGKTGTAEIIPAANVNQPWFIGFAPAEAPRVVIAVTIERSQGGTGGQVAAPIAKQVLEALL
jgi:peptidoglycan glycosyltransferase